nr:hypothetical protein L203_02062 [Cryptococcus depauperatus CBS 7841]
MDTPPRTRSKPPISSESAILQIPDFEASTFSIQKTQTHRRITISRIVENIETFRCPLYIL